MSNDFSRSNNSSNFSSSRIPNYDKNLEKKVEEVIATININELSFLQESFYRYKYSNGYRVIPYDVERTIMAICGMDCEYFFTQGPLYNMEHFFKDGFCLESFESIYNTFNYIKNYLYQKAAEDYTFSKSDLFSDYEVKQEIVTDNIGEISRYLDEIKFDTNLKLSISNNSISRNINKRSKDLSLTEKSFIEAVAFCSDIDKLEQKEYSQAKRLLYLPHGKRLKK